MKVNFNGSGGRRKKKIVSRLLDHFDNLIPKGTKRVGMTADEFHKKINDYFIDDKNLIRHFVESDDNMNTFSPVFSLSSHLFFREMLKVLISSIEAINKEKWEGESISDEERIVITHKLLQSFADGAVWEVEGIPYESFRGIHKRVLDYSTEFLERFAVIRLIASILLSYGLKNDIEYPKFITIAEDYFTLSDPIEPDELDGLIEITAENLATNTYGYSILRTVKITDRLMSSFLNPSIELYFILVDMLEKWLKRKGYEYYSREVSTPMQLQIFRISISDSDSTNKRMWPVGKMYEERTRELLDAALAIPDK